MIVINAQDLRVGDRVGSSGWTVEQLTIRLRQSREVPGAVIAAGNNGRGERFALNCKPHRPVQVKR